MKLLIDTHVVLWWLDDPGRIETQARMEIAEGRNEVLDSVASEWEIAIKRSTGKLEAPADSKTAIRTARFATSPIELRHALTVETLPNHHRDPFDRMLVALSIVENLTIVMRDPHDYKYDAGTIRS